MSKLGWSPHAFRVSCHPSLWHYGLLAQHTGLAVSECWQRTRAGEGVVALSSLVKLSQQTVILSQSTSMISSLETAVGKSGSCVCCKPMALTASTTHRSFPWSWLRDHPLVSCWLDLNSNTHDIGTPGTLEPV